MEPIHIELSNEGGIVVVLEQLGDQGLREFILIQYDEAIALLRPSDQVLVLSFFEEAAKIFVSA